MKPTLLKITCPTMEVNTWLPTGVSIILDDNNMIMEETHYIEWYNNLQQYPMTVIMKGYEV